jgi:hypothetical protein
MQRSDCLQQVLHTFHSHATFQALHGSLEPGGQKERMELRLGFDLMLEGLGESLDGFAQAQPLAPGQGNFCALTMVLDPGGLERSGINSLRATLVKDRIGHDRLHLAVPENGSKEILDVRFPGFELIWVLW